MTSSLANRHPPLQFLEPVFDNVDLSRFDLRSRIDVGNYQDLLAIGRDVVFPIVLPLAPETILELWLVRPNDGSPVRIPAHGYAG